MPYIIAYVTDQWICPRRLTVTPTPQDFTECRFSDWHWHRVNKATDSVWQQPNFWVAQRQRPPRQNHEPQYVLLLTWLGPWPKLKVYNSADGFGGPRCEETKQIWTQREREYTLWFLWTYFKSMEKILRDQTQLKMYCKSTMITRWHGHNLSQSLRSQLDWF